MNEQGRWRGLGRFLVALYLFTVYLFICLHLGHTRRMVEDTGYLQSLSSLSFFLNLKRFICFAFIHVCSDCMYVCTSCMYLMPVEVRRGYWSNSPASMIFREAEWPASSQDPSVSSPFHQSWGYRHMGPHPAFTWVLGLWAQVLIFALQVLVPTEWSPQPVYEFLHEKYLLKCFLSAWLVTEELFPSPRDILWLSKSAQNFLFLECRFSCLLKWSDCHIKVEKE